MDRNNLILAVLSAAGDGVLFSPVQVQKLFFLMDREIPGRVNGPHFNFRPYDYGPFDRSVYDSLDQLASQGLVNIGGHGSYRVYCLTPAGFQRGRESQATLEPAVLTYIRDVAAWVRGLSFEQLVAAIYNKYPEMKEKSIFRS